MALPERNPGPRQPKKDWNTEKNGPKNAPHWDPEILRFDQDGAIHIVNQELARQIQSVMDTWTRRLTIYRDPFPEEKPREDGDEPRRPAVEQPSREARSRKTAPDSEGDPVKNQVNMMCPCAPEPPPPDPNP